MSVILSFPTLPDPASTSGQRIIVATVSLASLMGALDMSVVNITVPTIIRSWQIPVGVGSLIIISYMLTITGLILFMGKLGDRYGFRQLFLLGLVLFGLGSFLCGVATDITSLIVFRVLQGAGAAMFSAIGPAVITTYLPLSVRGKSLGFLIAMSAAGYALGPGIGGFVSQYAGWRWVFFLNLPIVLVALFMSWYCLPSASGTTEQKPLNITGPLIFVAALILVLSAFTFYQVPGTPDIVLELLLLAGVILGVIFVLRERNSPDPLINPALVRNRDFRLGILACLVITTLFSGVTYLMPLYLINSRHLDAALAGLIMTAPALLSILVAPATGSLADRHGSILISMVAVALAGAGFLIFFTFNPLTLVIVIIAGMLITRVSTAAFFGPNARLIMGHCPPDSVGDGSGVMMTVRHVGMVAGIAFFQSVFAIRMYMAGIPRDGTPLVSKLTPALSVLGYQAVYLVSFALCILVVIIIRLTREVPDEEYSTPPETLPPDALI
ncbi:MFS transporter [Methanoregula sp.]|uniref:MFS transporter n=1 Tax=Methanoregula sp. TaxID=2052170 RepID=UPI002C75B6D9|nr:MFS transporter [Methanoregula sp.]HVP97575.1 MFS transporter [Methanoregula sp.]